MGIFKYGQEELNYLKNKDEVLAAAIERIGVIERTVTPDLFEALINSVVSQQISTKAAATVWKRLLDKLQAITPETIEAATIEDIQSCGMSIRKAGYVKGCADAVMKGKINLTEMASLPDDEVIKCLSSLNGVGIWTAEMLLIFSMERPDVISYGDLGIRRGIMKLYGLESLTKQEFENYRKRYSPYGSVASLYLWELSK